MDILINIRQPCCYCKIWQISFVYMFSPNKNSIKSFHKETGSWNPHPKISLVKKSPTFWYTLIYSMFHPSKMLLQEKIWNNKFRFLLQTRLNNKPPSNTKKTPCQRIKENQRILYILRGALFWCYSQLWATKCQKRKW